MTSSFTFIPRTVKKKNHLPVSSHTPSTTISVGAQVTSESTLPYHVKRTKDIASSSEFLGKNEDDGSEHAAGTETKPLQPTTATSIAIRNDLEDLAQLVCLALSDYAVWADVDLRRKIDWGQGSYDDVHDTSMDDSKGYIPLAYLLRHSQVFRLVSPSSSIINQPQTTFIKAIRAHASHLIDVRLIIPSSSSSTFPRNNTTQWSKPHIQTGYELRRKEVSSSLGKHGKKEWDALTIYVENIPNQYRSIPGMIRFINGLLPPPSSLSIPSVPRIQNISLPSHHQDQPNTIPTCKGFALVTLSHDEDVGALLKAWCWDRPTDAMNSGRPLESDISSTIANTKGKGKDKECPDEEISSLAIKFGLRVLTKAKWEELRAEYLLYRQELVDEINAFQDEGEVRVYGSGAGERRYMDESHDHEEEIMEEDAWQTNQIHVRESAYIRSQSTKNAAIATNNSVGAAGNTAYPPGCLVFVRNIHPDTNKTTLRSLFLHARKTSLVSGEGGKKDDDGLDYLDYTKGMDCCHVRLRTPLHAQQLVHHLSYNPIVQTSGLDASGTSFVHLPSSDKDDTCQRPIVAEQVLGKREEVYWEKVPEKIRRQAVEKALSFLHNDSSCDVGITPITGSSGGDKKKRKPELEEHSADFNIQANSAYPPSCLVFIRNVHPETNKTTLRNLFSHAWEEKGESADPDGKKDEGGIDYLDYNKGMDCCYVRLRTPLHAQQLVHYLSSNPIIQTTGLNASGSGLGASLSDNRVEGSFTSTSQKPLVAEQILGKREELYWEKVPEKVRRQAVDKALSFLHGRGDSGGASSTDVSKGSKPSKRRKN